MGKEPRVARIMALLAAKQKRYGDTAPLTSPNPTPAEFVRPTPRRKTYRGGAAPAEAKK